MDEQKKKLALLGGLGVAFLLVFIVFDPIGLRGGGGEQAPPVIPGSGGPGAPGMPTGTPGIPPGGPTAGQPPAPNGGFTAGAPAPSGAPPAPSGEQGPPKPAEGFPPQLPSRPDPMAPLNPQVALASARPPWLGNNVDFLPPLSYSAVVPKLIQPPRFPRIEQASKPPAIEARDMRLSGILLNGSLYVILETGSLTTEPRGYVVKPGDEVEGIKVLKIERYRENGQFVTRALLRLPGPEREERYVYLRSGAPPPLDTGQGAGDPGAMPGGGTGTGS